MENNFSIITVEMPLVFLQEVMDDFEKLRLQEHILERDVMTTLRAHVQAMVLMSYCQGYVDRNERGGQN